MAYNEQTSVATAADMIDRIATFAGANGWTVERNNLVGANRTVTLRKAGVSDYVHLYNTNVSTVRMRVSVGYSAGDPPASQPNVSSESICWLEDGPFPKAFLFADGNAVWVTIAIAKSGEYRHLAFGVLEKVGDYVGGTYVDGSNWGNTYWAQFWSNHAPFLCYSSSAVARGCVRADADGRSNNFFYYNGTTVAPNPTFMFSEVADDANGIASCLVNRADKNAFSGRSIFHTIPLYVARTGSQTYYSPAGVVHDVRFCSINKFEPEQEITIGSDVYKVFPVAGKRPMNDATGVQPAASGDYGYAIRKVA